MKRAMIGGIAATCIIFIGAFMVGRLNNYEALDFLRAMLPSTRFLCSAVITSTSTILALILTLITFSSQSEGSIKSSHYERITLIAKLATMAFIGAVFLLLLLNLPLEDASDKLLTWYKIIFYIILGYTAVLGGMLITIMLLLYKAAVDTILIVHPDYDNSSLLIVSKEDEEEMKDQPTKES